MHIKLTRDYPIRGERRRKGEVVEVIDASAAWLIGQGIAIDAAGGSETDNSGSETDNSGSETDNSGSETDNRQAQIEAAIRDLLESDPERTDEEVWTKAGKPDVKALELLLGLDISAAERDAAWESVA